MSALLGITLASPTPVSERQSLAARQSLNGLIAEILAVVPGINGDINDVSGTLTTAYQTIADLTDTQTTYNQLGGACTTYTIIFARGTAEPGNVGILTGPPLFEALGEQVDSSEITIQGVNDYSASVEGYLEGGEPAAGTEM